MTRPICPAGRDLLRDLEAFRSIVYQDSAGVLTIGYGHTGPDVLPGSHCTRADAEALLTGDLARFESAVERLVTVPLNDNQHAALVIFAFNVGITALRGSTLLRELNGGNYACVPSELARWNRSGGQVVKGLVNRRAAEARLWVLPVTAAPPAQDVVEGA